MSTSRGPEQDERVGNEVRRTSDPHEHVAGDQGAGLRARGERARPEAMLQGGQGGDRRAQDSDEGAERSVAGLQGQSKIYSQ